MDDRAVGTTTVIAFTLGTLLGALMGWPRASSSSPGRSSAAADTLGDTGYCLG